MLKRLIQGFLDLFYPIFRRFMPYQVYAYLAVGAINTALNIALFILFFQFVLPERAFDVWGLPIQSYTVSLLLAFIITVPTGFWLAKYFAFNSKSTHKHQSIKQLGKYFLVVLQGLGSDWLILKGLIVFFNVYPSIAKIISTVVVLTLNYLLQKYFTFKHKEQ